mmetsp:Transcript_98988/g.317462  ORF Transcript_98988/g.317462 Transcript_98988/m.317462 type:complete len:495 (+) Transcript_98988:106-1590(+)
MISITAADGGIAAPLATAASGPPVADLRRGSVQPGGNGGQDGGSVRQGSKGPKTRASDWTPWKDRITKTGHRDAVLFVAFVTGSCGSSSVRRTLVSAAADGSVRLFDLNRAGREPTVRLRLTLEPPASGSGVAVGTTNRGFCTCFDFCARFGAMGDESALVEEGAEAQEGEENGNAVVAAAVVDQPSGGNDVCAVIFAGYDSGCIVGWDVAAQGRMITMLSGHGKAVTSLRCRARLPDDPNPDAVACLVSASVDGTVRVWSLDRSGFGGEAAFGGQCLFTLEFGSRNPVSDFVFLPGASVVTCSWDGALRNVDLAHRKCVSLTQVAPTSLRSICASDWLSGTESVQIWAGTDDGEISGWTTLAHGDLERVGSWKAHHAEVTALRLWGRWLISGSEDRTIRLWMASNFSPIEEFRGHAGAVLALSLADGDWLLWSGARDWTIRSWDLREVQQHLWERDRMVELDAESLAWELELRSQAKALKKAKKPKKAASKKT